MIRINLLPVREARRKATLQQQVFALSLALAATIGLCWMVHIALTSKVSVTEQRIAQLSEQIEGHKPQQAKVDQFKKKKADIRAKLDVIAQLERSRSGPVRMLDALATHIPDRMWITNLDAQHGEVQIEGLSLDNELVALFLTALGDSPFFTNVELESTELKEIEKLKLNSFRIRAAVATPEDDGETITPKPTGAKG